MEAKGEVTRLISLWISGDRDAENQLYEMVYNDLRIRARSILKLEQNERSLGSAGLVHLAYLDLHKAGQLDVNDRAHFLNLAATVMRRIIVDRARARTTQKRGGDLNFVPVEESLVAGDDQRLGEALMIDQVLKKPGLLSVRQETVVNMLYYAGYSIEEAALLLNVSSKTVKRDFQTAKAKLRLAIQGHGADNEHFSASGTD